jgi:hypothetical protein
MRGERGNRNTFHPPVTVSRDPRIAKNVPLTEGVRLQFLAEGFNLLNHGNIVAVRPEIRLLSPERRDPLNATDPEFVHRKVVLVEVSVGKLVQH